MKRRHDAPDEVKKRLVDYATFQKWRLDLDREHQTMSWLDCNSEKEGTKTVVMKLKCRVCTEFVDKIRCGKNFSEKWIVGAESVRISNVRDHARNWQHTRAMSLLKKQQSQFAGLGPSSYAPIARAFNKLPDDERAKLRVKFDIAYFIAIENLPYTKYAKICELENRHGVCVGASYVCQ